MLQILNKQSVSKSFFLVVNHSLLMHKYVALKIHFLYVLINSVHKVKNVALVRKLGNAFITRHCYQLHSDETLRQTAMSARVVKEYQQL